ncbi:MAG: tetratricopeptide repeat protein [Xanthomonadaceae bacterium]|jgi:tetratricopeptide (TPR) repeat protein|nr:tetratricopeptide repeat protein [Xanthomonadaceae bacterium]
MPAAHRPAPRLRALVAAVLLAAAHAAGAAAQVKPVPQPDLASLPEETRQVLSETRRQFDEARPTLVGLYLAEAYAQLGAIYARYGQLPAARAALENAAAVAPEDGRFPYLLGFLSTLDRQPARARDEFRLALSLDAQYLPIRWRLAAVQLELGDLAGARATVEPTAKARPDLAPAAAILGEVALREKRHADAERWFAQALKADPKATALHARRAEALAALGRSADAEAARRQAGDATPGFTDPLVEGIYAPPPMLPSEQALALAAQGKHAEGAALLDAALKVLPEDPDLLAAYARLEADRGRMDAATARADAALKARPDAADALLAKGMVLEMQGREADARSRYEAAVRADLKLAPARLALGNALMRAQQWTQAAEQYRQLAAIEAGAGNADGRLAAALARGGRCADALKEINATLARRPRDGGLLQTFVRLAATCPAASAEEKRMAADYGLALYKQRPDEGNTEALALATAAQGRKDEAVDYQAQAIFEAVKRNDDAAVARLRAVLEEIKAGRQPALPWAQAHPLMAPPRLAPSAAPAAG